LKLGRLFFIEISVIITVLIVTVIIIQVDPSLAGSKQAQLIGAYNQKVIGKDTITIAKGDAFSTQFGYSSFEPAVLVLDLTFTSCQSSGYLNLECNGRYIGTILVTPDNHHTIVSAISVTGAEWVKPPSLYSDTFTNQIIFSSDSSNGYAGTFDFQIRLKGST
jgi:hypothetical protein